MPGTLPIPASTTIANVRPMYWMPENGSTGLTTIKAAPASEAVAIAIPKPLAFARVGLRPQILNAFGVVRDRAQREPCARSHQDAATCQARPSPP